MSRSVAVAAAEKRADFEKLYAWFERLDAGCNLGQVLQAAEQIAEGHAWQLEAAEEDGCAEGDSRRGFQTSLGSLRQAARRAALAARQELQQISLLTGLCRQFSAMDFRFLFHPQRKLLAVGFNVNDRRCDESYYDLLASEARLTSFLAVSHGQLPLEHWFALGRMVTVVSGTPTLLSWSGSMFEYLLPMLIMPSYRATLLGRDLPCGGETSDTLCPPARRSLGDFRKLLQHPRRRRRLWISCFRRAGAGPGTGPGRAFGDCSLCRGLGTGRGSARSLRQPGSAGAAWAISAPMVFTMRSTIRRSLAGRAARRSRARS